MKTERYLSIAVWILLFSGPLCAPLCYGCGDAQDHSSVTRTADLATSVGKMSLTQVAFGRNIFVAVGTGGMIMTSKEGMEWTRRESGTIARLHAVAFGDGQFIAVGDSGTILGSVDGANWTWQSCDTST